MLSVSFSHMVMVLMYPVQQREECNRGRFSKFEVSFVHNRMTRTINGASCY